MAQITALTVYGIPGQVQAFTPKVAVPSKRIYPVEQAPRIFAVEQETRVLVAVDTRTEAID